MCLINWETIGCLTSTSQASILTSSKRRSPSHWMPRCWDTSPTLSIYATKWLMVVIRLKSMRLLSTGLRICLKLIHIDMRTLTSSLIYSISRRTSVSLQIWPTTSSIMISIDPRRAVQLAITTHSVATITRQWSTSSGQSASIRNTCQRGHWWAMSISKWKIRTLQSRATGQL